MDIKNNEQLSDSSLLTEKPILLNEGPEHKYVLFGDWPQSLKKDNVIIDESKIYKINKWDCYKGSDNAFYIKEKAKPYKITEDDTSTFTNGEKIVTDKEYFFKIESIKWRILNEKNGEGIFLLADKALMSCCFDTHFQYDDKEGWIEDGIDRTINGNIIHANNYEYSSIRAYLNGLDGSSYDEEDYSGIGFINKAFTRKAIEMINTTNVDNSKESTTDNEDKQDTADEYVCNDTKDKVFLLSEREATNKEFGFDSYDKGTVDANLSSSRSIGVTDYSLATGTYSFSTELYKNTCCWWLRSPISDVVVSARNVYFDGSNDYSSACVDNTDVAVVPAIVITL